MFTQSMHIVVNFDCPKITHISLQLTQIQRHRTVREHDTNRAFHTVINEHEWSRLFAISPHFELSGGHNSFATECSRRLFSTTCIVCWWKTTQLKLNLICNTYQWSRTQHSWILQNSPHKGSKLSKMSDNEPTNLSKCLWVHRHCDILPYES